MKLQSIGRKKKSITTLRVHVCNLLQVGPVTLCQSAPGLLPAGTVKGKCLPSGTCDTSAASAGRIWAIHYKILDLN